MMQAVESDARIAQQNYLHWLYAFAGAFVFRVVAQLTQKFYNFSLLPPYQLWDSGSLPYSWLLASQLVIIALFGRTIIRFKKGTSVPNYNLGKWLLLCGSCYFLLMFARLIAGLTLASEHAWWGAKIPSFFHLVIAAFIITAGHFHFRYGPVKHKQRKS